MMTDRDNYFATRREYLVSQGMSEYNAYRQTVKDVERKYGKKRS